MLIRSDRATLPRHLRDHFRACCLMALVLFLPCESATAQADLAIDRSTQNLMVVLRESVGGANKQDETLQPMGRMRAKLPDGKEVVVESAAFLLLGDMHMRFVFDGPSFMPNAKPRDLARLGLTPEQALHHQTGVWQSCRETLRGGIDAGGG
jgi:hypothetical protein